MPPVRGRAAMKTYAELLDDAARRVRQIMPWDLAERLAREPGPIVVDVREPAEYAGCRIRGGALEGIKSGHEMVAMAVLAHGLP